MNIPSTLERLIHKGKAEAKVFSTGLFYQSVLPIPKHQWAVIYGYWYKPYTQAYGEKDTSAVVDFWDNIQWVIFSCRNKLYPFFHFVNQGVQTAHTATYLGCLDPGNAKRHTFDVPTDYRSCYIPITEDTSIAIARNYDENGYAWGSQTIPENSDFYTNNFSYAGQTTNVELQGYNNWADTTFINDPLDSNSAYVRQNYPNLNLGTAPDQRNYTGNGTEQGLGLCRLPYLTIYYVLMNFPPPQTIK